MEQYGFDTNKITVNDISYQLMQRMVSVTNCDPLQCYILTTLISAFITRTKFFELLPNAFNNLFSKQRSIAVVVVHAAEVTTEICSVYIVDSDELLIRFNMEDSRTSNFIYK